VTEPTAFDLDSLFGTALEEMVAHRQEVNDLDGYNGNHGDNMVENLGIIRDALSAQQGKPPADALRYATHELETRGRGGTSQYYVNGLNQAAEQLQGRSVLDRDGVMSIAQSLLGAIPAQAEAQSAGSVLDQVLGLAGGQQGSTGGGDLLGSVLGGLMGGAASPPPETMPEAATDDGLGVDDVLGALLPAGLAFLRARQSGENATAAAGQALISGLLGGQANPLQAKTPRAAAGGLVAQSLLKALVGGTR
jgi:hypothetical protein